MILYFQEAAPLIPGRNSEPQKKTEEPYLKSDEVVVDTTTSDDKAMEEASIDNNDLPLEAKGLVEAQEICIDPNINKKKDL